MNLSIPSMLVLFIYSSSAPLSGPHWGGEINLYRALVQPFFSADRVAVCVHMSHLFSILFAGATLILASIL